MGGWGGRCSRLVACVVALVAEGVLVGEHHHAVEGEECALGVVNGHVLAGSMGFQRWAWRSAYHKVRGVGLELVDRLELIEAGSGAWQAQVRRLLHQAKLGVDVLELFIVGQGVPR